MTTTAVAPKIVGKALYLELVGDSTIEKDALRHLLGWQYEGTKQVIIFPEYQDDTGKVWGAVIMSRLVSSYSPKAQWDFTYVDRLRPKPNEKSRDDHYVSYNNYSASEWAELTERERFDSHKRGLEIVLRNQTISTTYGEPDSEGNRPTIAKQGWVVRESKPIAVEVTDQDFNELHLKSKTPQAVIRRINKVRETLDKFPAKLA
jgi:hypothetical protein